MASVSDKTPANERIVSVDALRGFDMFWIVGGRPVVLALVVLVAGPLPDWLTKQFEHPPWNGFSAWDMIMPLFLFTVGIVMPFSFAKRIERGDGKAALYRKIAWRTIVLFILGMAAQGHLLDFDLATLKIYCNTLQAIACGYCLAAVLMLNLSIVGQLVATAGLLVGYWELMMLVPVPGEVAGLLQRHVNLARHVDQAVMGSFRPDNDYTWILSGMTFTATVLLGVMAGHLLRSRWRPSLKVLWLLVAGAACLGLGWIWSFWFPLNKHIWSSSMTLWSAGWCYLLLALFYLVIDVWGFRKWAFPFVVIGGNAIFVYMLTHLIRVRQVSDPLVSGIARHCGSGGDLVKAAAAVLLAWLVLFYMYRKKTFVRV